MALMLFGFLALYTWNARTGYLDSLAEESGLELTGYLLRPGAWAADTVRGIWNHYFALVDVAEENAYLRQELRQAEEYLATAREEQAELIRLRALFGVSAPEGWVRMGSRVLAGRFGPNAAIESILIDRGYASGAPPGAPVLMHKGLAGKVYRASSHSATVQLLTDTSYRVAVLTQTGRVPGVLSGSGPRALLELRYVPRNVPLTAGEILVTSGMDGGHPKGIPVAVIVAVSQENEGLFQSVQAEPLTSLEELEEVAVLTPSPVRYATQPLTPFPAPAESPLPSADEKPAPENAPYADGNVAALAGAPTGQAGRTASAQNRTLPLSPR